MPTPNGVLLPFLLFLVSASVFSQNWLVLGSSVQQQSSIKRPDPLRYFKYYNGVYDVRNKHYWASTAFTGVHGYATAAVWLLCGLGFGIFMTLKHQSMSNWAIKDFLDHQYCFTIMFLLVLLFTFLALVCASLVLSANQQSTKKIEKMKETIGGLGREAGQTIRKVIQAMTRMQKHLVPYDSKMASSLSFTTHQLGKVSRVIHSVVDKDIVASIHRAIQTSYVAHLVIVIFDLVLIVAALVLIPTHWYPGFVIIIFLCWILTTMCWVLTGIDFFLHTFAEDTCWALEDVKLNPQNNSLSSMLPCMDTTYSRNIMLQIGSTVHNFITQLNYKASEFSRLLGLDEQNDSIYGVVLVCNPFKGPPNYNYVPESCPEDAIHISQLPQVLASFTCYEEKVDGECKRNGRVIPEAIYNMAKDYSEAIQDLLNVYPDLKSLAECKLVQRFSDAVLHQCKPLKVAIRFLWLSMLCLSILMVALVLTCLLKAFQDRGKSFSVCSINPLPQ